MDVSKNFFFPVHNEAAAAADAVPLVHERYALLLCDVPTREETNNETLTSVLKAGSCQGYRINPLPLTNLIKFSFFINTGDFCST